MNESKRQRVLAIALDAAEPTLVRRLIEQGEMPVLRSLMNDGKWLRVQSTAYVGSGSVWPTFISGQDPRVHGVYGEWLWNPDSMSLSRYRGNDLIPFWKPLTDRGIGVGVLDIPFMPMVGIANGFEVSEWGAHDVLEGVLRVGPGPAGEIVPKTAKHPFETRVQLSGPHDYLNLRKLGELCVEGIKLRGNLAQRLISATNPDLSLIAFTEIHHAAHYLWHKVEPDHPIYQNNSIAQLEETKPNLIEIFREVDCQIGELIRSAGPQNAVMIFSLHGMQPAHGSPAFLGPLLGEMGLARLTTWNGRSWRLRAKAAFGSMKKNTPAVLKKMYYKTLPPGMTHQLAQPTMLPFYDWKNTKAFSLPTDQHGWIRINLIGREASGIVPPDEYEELCRLLELKLSELRSDHGELLVRDVIRTAGGETARNARLPDLIIHWADAAFHRPLRIAGSRVEAEAVGKKYVGQHGLEGFCIIKNGEHALDSDDLRAGDMRNLISKLLGVS